MKQAVVAKIGGATLFSKTPLLPIADELRHEFPQHAILLIAGGGELVESMRMLHKLRPELDDQRMHWRCIELLKFTTELAAESTPGIPILGSRAELQSTSTLPTIAWVQPGAFYSPTTHLPIEVQPAHNWSTTSDTLAWLLAFRLKIPSVLLFKSCDIDGIESLEQAAALGVVDRELPRLAACTPDLQIQLRSTKT